MYGSSLNGRARAFVTFKTHDDAKWAMKGLNYTKLNGIPMRLLWADPETTRIRRSTKGVLLIKNIAPNIEVSQLHDAMENFGEVISCKMWPEPDGTCTGRVQFRHQYDANRAMDLLQEAKFDGRPVKVERCEERQVEENCTNVTTEKAVNRDDTEPGPFKLSARGVGDAASFERRDFVFVVGGVEYECCRFQACFVSGLVRRLLAADRCVSRVCLKVKDEGHNFKDVVKLMNGHSISVTTGNARFLEDCARELENDELLDRVVWSHTHGDVSSSNVLDRLRLKRESHSDCKDELDFLASHFFEIGFDVVKGLSISDLEQVLTNPLLTLASEDQLFGAIQVLAEEKGEDALVLLRYVEFAFLSESKLNEFLELIFPDRVAYMWDWLCEWMRLSQRSDAKVDFKKTKRYCDALETFPLASGSFNGIFNYLRVKCGGNPHETGVIKITDSSTKSGMCYSVVDSGGRKGSWASKDEPYSYLQFDFKSMRVCLSGYSLKSGEGNNLMSWTIEVSADGQTWEVVDERKRRGIAGASFQETHECLVQNGRLVRFVRIRNGDSMFGSNSLVLSQIEFFGKLKK